MTYFPTTAEEVAAYFKDRMEPVRISYDDTPAPAETISLVKLNNIVLYEPEEMIVSVQSGVSLMKLENALAEKGQWIPTLVASENPETSVGSAIINDWYHPRSGSMGMLRTSILGGTFCTTSGEIFKSGSRVVKSVAGYDIHRAFCGSNGLFGAIISVTLKVQPKPEMFFRFRTSTENASDLFRYSPTICQSVDNTLIVELAGYKEDVEEDIRLLSERIFIEEEITGSQWVELLERIRENHVSAESNTDELLSTVRKVFDPKGILF